MIRTPEPLGNGMVGSDPSPRDDVPELLTTGRLAEILRVAPHRIRFILQTRNHIKPVARAAHMLLYGNTALAQVRHEINAIDARRSQPSDNQQLRLFDEDNQG